MREKIIISLYKNRIRLGFLNRRFSSSVWRCERPRLYLYCSHWCFICGTVLKSAIGLTPRSKVYVRGGGSPVVGFGVLLVAARTGDGVILSFPSSS